ncbi:MAG: DUF3990 domain-containing protein [Clostridiales bacterium]|nr:DUF3990 domain-containing protein [Clostridiales bacterium]
MKRVLYHGSDHIVGMPSLTMGSLSNDYGRGFYCTEIESMACEWACKKQTNGFVNRYELGEEDLRILDLADGNHTVLNWIAVLLKNRSFKLNSPIAQDARDYLVKNFGIDTHRYDLIKGYRADDSYFQYAESFVSNTLPLRSLNRALMLGKLGMQTALVSKKAFDKLSFIDAYQADVSTWFPRFNDRDTEARKAYKDEVANSRTYRDDIYMLDILREGIRNDDPRIQRIILK